MSLEDMMARPVVGINPFNELPIDAEIWRLAHAHHHTHRYLHALAAHRPGVVLGLEVIASEAKERTIIIAPGLAIDPEGRTIVVREPVVLTVEPVSRMYIYITLAFLRTHDRASGVMVGDGQQYYKEVEGYDLTATKELPKTPFLELARIYCSTQDKTIRNAANSSAPGSDEINRLYCPAAFPHCYADVGVGELSYVPKTSASPWNPNRSGLWNLLREGNGEQFHLTFTGSINLMGQGSAAPSAEPALLYVAGRQSFQPLKDAEVDGLRQFLDGGGMLLGEAGQGSSEFAAGFEDLVGQLGAKLKPVTKGHSLLTAHHVFSAPPPGGQSSGTLSADADNGIVFSTYDYGAAWQGEVEKPDAPEARSRIRQAQEFGLNIIAAAAQRRRTHELSRLG
jgi:hypothetical protein